MINVNRALHIDAAPEAVFAVLSDPQNLAGLMPRVRRVELIDQQPDHARIATYMSFGLFGDIRTEGEVRWRDDREIVFSARRPVSVEARWTLTPSNGGTDLQATLALDLAPLIGPLAAFVPQHEVANMIGPDLEAALAGVARRVAHNGAVLC
jgi:carbon monoxide dehydrogenase subunit G